jgi:2-keto-4-pentenoate hydratase
MEAQLRAMAGRLAAGAERIGWKVGLNAAPVQRALGIERPVVGHLTSATLLEPGGAVTAAGGTRVGIEPEVAVRLGRDLRPGVTANQAGAAIATLGPALEVVDVDLPFEDVEPILAGNVFHRGVLLGPAGPPPAEGMPGIRVRVARNGADEHEAEAASAMPAPGEVVALVAGRLAECGEALRAGDTVICGSLTPIVWVEPGDEVEADFGPLGMLTLSFV